jgi:hypothetical protein
LCELNISSKVKDSQVWWYISINPGLKRQRQLELNYKTLSQKENSNERSGDVSEQSFSMLKTLGSSPNNAKEK